MPVNLNPQISFQQHKAFPMGQNLNFIMTEHNDIPQVKQNVAEAPIALNTVKSETKNSKKGGFRNFLANVGKFFTTATEMTKASAKALFYGSATGAATLFGFWALGALPKQIKNKSVKEAFTKPLKSISTFGKVAAGAAALAVASVHIIKGIFNSNQRAAVVEHKLDVKHEVA